MSLYWLQILQVVLGLKCRGAEDKRAAKPRQYFFRLATSQWHFQRLCSPFRCSGGGSLLLRNWLYPVLGPDGSPLTFLMCQAFFCPSDQSAVVGQAIISAHWYISGTNSAWVLLLNSNIKSCSVCFAQCLQALTPVTSLLDLTKNDLQTASTPPLPSYSLALNIFETQGCVVDRFQQTLLNVSFVNMLNYFWKPVFP